MAIRKNKKRIDPRYFLDEKMQIPAQVIEKCVALTDRIVAGPGRDPAKQIGYDPHTGAEYAEQSPEEAEIAYAELQREYDRLRCDDTLERAEAYGDLGPTHLPGKIKLKR